MSVFESHLYVPASTPATVHLRRVVRRSRKQQLVPVVPGAPVNRSVFQADFPLGVAQRVEGPKPVASSAFAEQLARVGTWRAAPTPLSRTEGETDYTFRPGRFEGQGPGPPVSKPPPKLPSPFAVGIVRGLGLRQPPRVLLEKIDEGVAALGEAGVAVGAALAAPLWLGIEKVMEDVLGRDKFQGIVTKQLRESGQEDNPDFTVRMAAYRQAVETGEIPLVSQLLTENWDVVAAIPSVVNLVRQLPRLATAVAKATPKVAAETTVRVPVRRVQEAGLRLATGRPGIAGAAAAKEPWQMTRLEFEQQARTLSARYEELLTKRLKGERDIDVNSPVYRNATQDALRDLKKELGRPELDFGMVQGAGHRGSVRFALQEGKPVPPEVLADYPDLVPGAPSAAVKGPSVAAGPAAPARAPRARVRRAAPEPAAEPLAAEPVPGATIERGAVPSQAAPTPLAAGQVTPPPAPAATVVAAAAPPPVKPLVSEAALSSGQPERGFITHTAESPMGSPILRELYDKEPIVYSPITNRETLQKASEAVNADPIAARARLMADVPLNPEMMVDELAQGFVLMRKAANEGNVIELRDLSKRIAERITPVAQALQVASTIDKLSPEGLFVYVQRIIEQAVKKRKGPAVATRLRTAGRRAAVKEAVANAASDVASAGEKVVQARKSVSNAVEMAARARTPKGNQRAKDLQYLIDDTVREVQAKLTPAERQAIIKAKAILKQSVAEMDVATANSFLDRAADLKNLDGEARVEALMGLIDEVRQLPQVQANLVAGMGLKPSPRLLKQQAADLAQLIDRTSRNIFQQLNSVDRLAVARVKAILRRTDVELPQGMAESLLEEAHNLRGLPLAERASALNRLTAKIKEFDPVAKELARKRVVADAEARVRQAARQAANDLAALIDASSRKVVKHVTTADRQAISQAKTVLRRFGAELPSDMAQDFLARAKALNNLPDVEQAAGVKALVNEIKDFSPVKQAREELALLRAQVAEAKRSAKDLQYLAHAELRASKVRLRNVERETIRSAKARLKDAGVEMSEELARSFLDRAKALRGITDEYDQMRAAQSLLTDVHSLVPGSKINTFFDIIGLPRIFQAAYDLSFSLRQGIVHAWAHPKQWAGMFKAGLKSFASEDAALAADRQFFKRPLHKPGQEAGLEYIDRWGSISQQEETYINRWAERVPGVRQSNRAYIAQGNKLRADAFDAYVMDWLPPDMREEVYWGRKRFETLDELVAATGKTRKDFESLAQWQNVLTGRGDLGNFLRSNNQWLNALFYAPRFALSRIETPIYAGRNIVTNPALRKLVAKDLAASLVGSTAALYMVSKLPGVEVEWNPLSSDWRKAKLGPLRISFDGGFDTLIRQVVQLSLGKRKVTGTGETIEVSRAEVLARYLVSKFSPVVSFIRDALAQRTFIGEPLDTPEAWAGRVAEAWTPFVAQDVYEATQELGPMGIGVAPLSGFGAGVATYGLGLPSEWAKDFEPYFALPTDSIEVKAEKTLIREKYREKNPEIDARLFITGQVDSLQTAKAVAQVAALIKEYGINPEKIRGIQERKERLQKAAQAGTRLERTQVDALIAILEEGATGTTPAPSGAPSGGRSRVRRKAIPTPVPVGAGR